MSGLRFRTSRTVFQKLNLPTSDVQDRAFLLGRTFGWTCSFFNCRPLLAELLVFRIRFRILQTLQTCKLTTRPETWNFVGTHIVFYPSTSGSPPTLSGAPPRSRWREGGFHRLLGQETPLQNPTLRPRGNTRVEVCGWSDFVCLVAFLKIADFCSKSTKTQRGTPLRFGHRSITKIINYLFI